MSRLPVFRSLSIVQLVQAGLSLVNQMLIAALFGAGMRMDAYYVALGLPLYFDAVLVGSLTKAFLPKVVALRKAGIDPTRYIRWVVGGYLALITVLIALSVVFAERLIGLAATGLDGPTRELAAGLYRILAPSLWFSGMSLLLTSLHETRESFVWPAIARLMQTVSILLVIVVGADAWGVQAIAAGYLLGSGLQLVWLALRRGRPNEDLAQAEEVQGAVRETLRLTLPIMVAGIFTHASLLADRWIASFLPDGDIARLGYAWRLTIAVLPFLMNLVTVFFPTISGHVGDPERFRETFSKYFRFAFVLCAPIVAVGAVGAAPLIRVVFLRGDFTPEDARVTALIFQAYLGFVMLSISGGILSHALYALKANKAMAAFSVLFQAFNVGLSWVLAMRVGVVGIAWATTATFVVAHVVFLILLRRRAGRIDGAAILVSGGRIAAAAVAAGVSSWGCLLLLEGIGAGRWSDLLRVGALSATGSVVYVLALRAAGSAEYRWLVEELARRKNRSA